MSLKEEDRQILVELELEKAEKTFRQVKVLQREGYWDTMANRLYYSLFHAVSALLINDQREVGSHKGAAIRFHQYYVKTGILSPDEGALFKVMFSLRHEDDYEDFIEVERADIEEYTPQVSALVKKLKSLVK